MRISDNDLKKKMIRQIMDADPVEAALMAENLLGVKAEHDSKEYYEWSIEPIPELYCGAFDIEGLTAPS